MLKRPKNNFLLKGVPSLALLGFILLGLSSASAQSPMIVLSTPGTPRQMSSRASGSCAAILSPPIRYESYISPSFTDSSKMVEHIFVNQSSSNEAHDFSNTLLNRWELSRRFEETDLVRLHSTARSRDLDRTTYIGFSFTDDPHSPLKLSKDGDSFNGLRFFDGSTTPLFRGLSNTFVKTETRKLTFEDELGEVGFELPERVIERITGVPKYIFEIGLLNIERDVHDGARVLLSILSRFVDAHYNAGSYSEIRNLSYIQEIQPVIYIRCAKKHLKIYEKLGFNVVNDYTRQKPVVINGGHYVMKMSASTLVSEYLDLSLRPYKRDDSTRYNEVPDLNQHRDRVTDWIEGLERNAPLIDMSKNFQSELEKLNELRRFYFHSDRNSEVFRNDPTILKLQEIAKELGVIDGNIEGFVKDNLYILFFEKYYQLAYGVLLNLPADQKHLFAPYLSSYRRTLLHHDPEYMYNKILEESNSDKPQTIPFF